MSKQITFDNIQFVSYGVHDTFPGKLNPITAAIRGESEMGGGGGNIFKTIVAIAIAVAIPVVAPKIALALGSSSILASAGVGAVMGAAGAKLTGGDWRTGALMGGLGGGIGSWQAGNSFLTSANPAQGTVGFAAPSSNTAVITNTGSGTGYFDATKNAFIDPSNGAVIPNANIAYGGTVPADIATQLSSGATVNPQVLANSMQAGSVTANTFAGGAKALGSTTLYDPNFGTGAFVGAGGTSPAYAGAGQPVGAAYQGTTLNAGADGKPVLDATSGQPVVQTGGGGTTTAPAAGDQSYFQALKGRVTDPSKMADMTLMMTPQIVGSIYASQAGREQQKRIDEYQAELKRLEGQDQQAYKAKLKEYNDFVAQAKAINPDYWAQQTANAAQVQGAKSLAEGFRDDRFAGLRSPGYGASERRRATLGLTANVGSAYDRGYAGGLDMRNTALSRAQSMYPTAPRGMQAGLKDIASMYSDLDTSRALAGQGATKMASYMTYPLLSKDTRDIYRMG